MPINGAPKTQKYTGLVDYIMRSQNPLNTAQGYDPQATLGYTQGLSQALLGMVPGAGLAGAAGYTPRYDENYFIPSGVDKGPSIKENIGLGNYGDAGLQALGLLGDMGWAAAAGAQVPKAAQRGMIRAYHGSPYDFDEFRLDKIGTGEGAQAYGHGLYFAENERVADSYRLAGQPTFQNGAINAIVNGALDKATQYGLTGKDAEKWATKYLNDVAKNTPIERGARQQIYDAINNLPFVKRGSATGRMYEVAIHSDPAKFLDWDKPLSEQQMAVANLAKRVGTGSGKGPTKVKMQAFLSGNESPERGIVATGADLYRALSDYGDKSQDVSGIIQAQGIPGIKYLDQGSRGTTGGDLLDVFKGPNGWQAKIAVRNRGGSGFMDPTDTFTTSKPYATEAEARNWARSKIETGTRNYVVFDPKMVEILRKYALLGTLGGGAMLGNDDGT